MNIGEMSPPQIRAVVERLPDPAAIRILRAIPYDKIAVLCTGESLFNVRFCGDFADRGGNATQGNERPTTLMYLMLLQRDFGLSRDWTQCTAGTALLRRAVAESFTAHFPTGYDYDVRMVRKLRKLYLLLRGGLVTTDSGFAAKAPLDPRRMPAANHVPSFSVFDTEGNGSRFDCWPLDVAEGLALLRVTQTLRFGGRIFDALVPALDLFFMPADPANLFALNLFDGSRFDIQRQNLAAQPGTGLPTEPLQFLAKLPPRPADDPATDYFLFKLILRAHATRSIVSEIPPDGAPPPAKFSGVQRFGPMWIQTRRSVTALYVLYDHADAEDEAVAKRHAVRATQFRTPEDSFDIQFGARQNLQRAVGDGSITWWTRSAYVDHVKTVTLKIGDTASVIANTASKLSLDHEFLHACNYKNLQTVESIVFYRDPTPLQADLNDPLALPPLYLHLDSIVPSGSVYRLNVDIAENYMLRYTEAVRVDDVGEAFSLAIFYLFKAGGQPFPTPDIVVVCLVENQGTVEAPQLVRTQHVQFRLPAPVDPRSVEVHSGIDVFGLLSTKVVFTCDFRNRVVRVAEGNPMPYSVRLWSDRYLENFFKKCDLRGEVQTIRY